MEGLTAVFVCLFFLSLLRTSTTLDTFTPTKSIRDGETLVSAGRIFELGFFSQGNSTRQYLGIWYVMSPGTIVWVANRGTPLTNQLGVLEVTDKGVLVLLNSTKGIVWSSNTSRTTMNPVAQLLDSGNLVVKDGNSENFLWQSFDYPCDTFLPEMKIGRNLVTGLDWFISSWKSTEDPDQGEFSIRLDTRGLPQLVVTKGAEIKVRKGALNDRSLNRYHVGRLTPQIEYIMNDSEVYYEYTIQNSSVLTRYVLNPSGITQRFLWMDRTHSWELFSTTPADKCDNYAFCGANASCHVNDPVCRCLEGFVPKSPKDWSSVDWSDGCVRRTPLDCNSGDGFLKYTGLKLPDTSSSWFDNTISLEECEKLCMKNCSCSAYANLDTTGGGSGCLLWFNDLIDTRVLVEGGQDLYIRMATSELDHTKKKRHSSKKKQAAIIVGSAIFVLGMLILGLVSYIWKKKLRKQGRTKRSRGKDYNNDGGKEDLELPIFDLTAIDNATDNFSSNNKLGEGGFGSVYKGTLLEGQEIAIKRLSKNSGQGMKEFRSEVILFSKLQHRNLVKLLGCCIQENEKMLVYEYMPNKSLDYFIFDQTKSNLLDWRKRIHIIDGIARGLLYLHQDSRLRIIHRDLKASNILLDNNMNPKISDFGLARIFGGDQTEANTNKVVGTYGYMSPEYAVHGKFSVKSDVFSFGVLVLEIVSGKKNRGFSHPDHHLNLIGHAWRLWIEDKPMELIEKLVGDSCTLSEVLRCIHVGLLCVQQKPEDRPNMSSVVLMLNGDRVLSIPRQPGFYSDSPEANSSCGKCEQCSANEMTMTFLEAR